MGDPTPEALELKCPGCGTYFRLTPKKGRLPSGSVPCPKCFAEIPVSTGRPVPGASRPRPNASSSSGARPTIPPDLERDNPRGDLTIPPWEAQKRQAEVLARLEELADDESLPSRTIAGFPGSLQEPSSAGEFTEPATEAGETSLLEDSLPAPDVPLRAAWSREPTRSTTSDHVLSDGEPILPDDERLKQDTAENLSPPTVEANTSQLLARLQQAPTSEEPMSFAGEPGPSSITLPTLKGLSAANTEAAEDKASSTGPETKPSLSALFQKVRDRQTGGSLREKLRQVSAATNEAPAASLPTPVTPPPLTDMEISEGELASIVETSSKDHSGLFDSISEPDPTAPPAAIQEASDIPGHRTSQSMLARLQRRQSPHDDPVDPISVGAAAERKGSGFIRLPTNEIQAVLGSGQFRLRIQDVIYEPVDRDGLTQLIKRGVLLGAEEIAEADGDWMLVSEHPVFEELRRKMAEEAHVVLTRLGATQKMFPVNEASSPTPDLPPTISEPSPADPFDFEDFEEFEEEAEAPELAPPLPLPEPPVPEPPAPEPRAPDLEPDPLALELPTPATEPASPEPDPPAPTVPPQGRRGSSALVIGFIVLALAATAGGLLFTDVGRGLMNAISSQDDDVMVETIPSIQEAVAQAQEQVDNAIPEAFSDPASADSWARDRLDDADTDRAAELLRTQWESGRRDQEFLGILLESLLETEDFALARRVALEAITLFPHGGETFLAMHRRAVESDEALFSYNYVDLGSYDGLQAITTYSVGDHRGVVFETDEGDRLLFKPERDGWSDGWRAEIAAYRFCELVACHFEILPARPALLPRATLDGFADDALRPIFDGAQWQPREELNGEEAVRGSLEPWPGDDLAPFPIEYTTLWTTWLTAASSSEFVSSTIEEGLSRLEDFSGGAFHADAVQGLEGTTTGDLARQISSLLVFDFLTNNWERFFTRTQDYGTNNPVHEGRLISRHNGDAFQPRTSRRVQGRFEWTTRFSRSTVKTIRHLDQDLMNQVLFPDATRAEELRLNLLWRQRSELLERVDTLVGRHGEDNVLLFP